MKAKRKCLWCGEKFIAEGKNCTRRTFCCIEHRNKYFARKYYHARGGAETQRDYLYKRRLLRFGIENLIQCQICGRWFRQVGSHIKEVHGITAREYREAYGFDVKRGQLPPDYRELKAAQVFENNTVKNLKAGKTFWFKKGQKGVGVYKRSPQTLKRLGIQGKLIAKKYGGKARKGKKK